MTAKSEVRVGPEQRRLRGAVAGFGALMLFLAAPVQAQQVTGYLVGYLDGDDTSLGLLGAMISPGTSGLRPVASIEGFILGYDAAAGETATLTTISPGLGVQYSAPDGYVMGRGSYQFVSGDDVTTSFFSSGESGPAVTVQGSYWGAFPIVEALATYNTAASYVWSEAKAYVPIIRLPPGSIDFGGEIMWQGDMDDDSTRSMLFGPLLRWATGNNVFTFVSGGMKNNQGDLEDTWYGRAAFVIVR